MTAIYLAKRNIRKKGMLELHEQVRSSDPSSSYPPASVPPSFFPPLRNHLPSSGAVQPPAQVDESQMGFHCDASQRAVQVGCVRVCVWGQINELQLDIFRVAFPSWCCCFFLLQGGKGEEEAGPRGVRVPGESLLGGAPTAGESSHLLPLLWLANYEHPRCLISVAGLCQGKERRSFIFHHRREGCILPLHPGKTETQSQCELTNRTPFEGASQTTTTLLASLFT